MNNIRVAIHQPNFFPWLGYFHKIAQSDIFIFLDDVQFPRGNRGCVVNRVKILRDAEVIWLTLPLKKRSSESQIACVQFVENAMGGIFSKLKVAYSTAPFFKETIEILKNSCIVLNNNLSDLNVQMIKNISTHLGFRTNFIKSSETNVKESKQERIIKLLQEVNGEIYISGQGAKKYQDQYMFESNNIQLMYQKFDPPSFYADKLVGIEYSILHFLFLYGFHETGKIINNSFQLT